MHSFNLKSIWTSLEWYDCSYTIPEKRKKNWPPNQLLISFLFSIGICILIFSCFYFGSNTRKYSIYQEIVRILVYVACSTFMWKIPPLLALLETIIVHTKLKSRIECVVNVVGRKKGFYPFNPRFLFPVFLPPPRALPRQIMVFVLH